MLNPHKHALTPETVERVIRLTGQEEEKEKQLNAAEPVPSPENAEEAKEVYQNKK